MLNASLMCPTLTRWNSLFDAIKNLLEHKQKLNDLMKKFSLKPFSENELDYLSEYCTVMSPIAKTLDHLQQDCEFYYAILLPTLFTLKKKLEDLRVKPLRFTKTVVEFLLQSFEKRFDIYLQLSSEVTDAIIASCTHPKFKLFWIPPDFNWKISSIKKDCIQAINEFSSLSSPVETHCDTAPNDDFYILSNTDISTELSAEEEFLSFLQDKSCNLQSLRKFPRICKTFLKFNTHLCSSASVERLFSLANLINCPNRNLSDNNFSILVFLKGNGNWGIF